MRGRAPARPDSVIDFAVYFLQAKRTVAKKHPARGRPPAVKPPPPVGPGRPDILIGALLVLMTVVLYWPATGCGFVNYDDPDYFNLNPWVQAGLTWKNVGWACTTAHAYNWHPLTWLSLMLDVNLYGNSAVGVHFTNLALHAVNVVLLFWLLRRLTGAVWRSALVAALFGWHPAHVESVAWVSERKDVLCTGFGLLALLCYARYAGEGNRRQEPEVRSQKSEGGGREPDGIPGAKPKASFCYGLALGCFTLGLLSKPMLVTWPVVLLVLDYWPLGRFKTGRVRALLLEKVPFLALAAAAGVVTFLVQQRTGAMVTVESLPLAARSGNAVVSYCRYLGELFWPTNLAFFYPHPHAWPAGTVVAAALFLAGLTALCWWQRRRQPYLLMGWLWYVATLVPVIGLVQVGAQAMADRYTYIPSVGVLVMTVWGAYELTRSRLWRLWAWSAAGTAALVFCLGLTRQQIGYWRDSEALFRHATEVTQNNHIARNNLGIMLLDHGQTDEAISQFRQAIRLRPEYPDAHYNLGDALVKQGQMDEAIREFQEAIRLKPENVEAHVNLGVALDNRGQFDAAVTQYQAALRLKPDDAETLNDLGYLWVQRGENLDQARELIEKAVRLEPENTGFLDSLGLALLKLNRPREGLEYELKAVAHSPRPDASLYDHLGDLYAALHQPDQAAKAWNKSLALDPDPQVRQKLGGLNAP